MLPKTHRQIQRRLVEQHLEPERRDGLGEGDGLESFFVVVEPAELVSLIVATGGVPHQDVIVYESGGARRRRRREIGNRRRARGRRSPKHACARSMVVPDADEVVVSAKLVLKTGTKISIQPDLKRYQNALRRGAKLRADACLPALRNPFEIALRDENISRRLVVVELRTGVCERLVADHDAKLVPAFGRNRGFDGVESAQLGYGDRVDREACCSKVGACLLNDIRSVAVEFVVAVDYVPPFEDGEVERDIAFCMLLMREDTGATPSTRSLASAPLSQPFRSSSAREVLALEVAELLLAGRHRGIAVVPLLVSARD